VEFLGGGNLMFPPKFLGKFLPHVLRSAPLCEKHMGARNFTKEIRVSTVWKILPLAQGKSGHLIKDQGKTRG
jgi:hypothetical protein